MSRTHSKTWAIFVAVLMLFSLFPSMMVMNAGQAAAAKSNSFKFDFGCVSSPVAKGYTQVSNETLYDASKGYGLSVQTDCRDRGAPNDLDRDFTNAGNYTFMVDVPNGGYYVKITSGDNIASNRTDIAIEGEDKGQIHSSKGQFVTEAYRIKVTDGQLDITFSNNGRVNAVVIVPDSPPTGVHLEQKALTPDSFVTLAWDPVSGAQSYKIYRKVKGEDKLTKIGSSETPEFTDDTALLGFTYQYQITQVNAAGIESAKSSALTVAMIDSSVDAPATPTNLAIQTAKENSLTFGWNSEDNALRYYVYRANSLDGRYKRIGITDNAQYTDRVSTTTHYFYEVYAVNKGGLSKASKALKSPIAKVILHQSAKMNRGLVAVKVDNGVFLSWRMFGTDPKNITFNLYRDGQKVNQKPIATSTNFLDPNGMTDSTYSVQPVIYGHERTKSDPVSVWGKKYLNVPIQKPKGGTTPDGVHYIYSANDASVADLDGDGQYEIVLKWAPSNSKDPSRDGYTGPVYLDAYELNGTRLWRIDLGINIRAGAHTTPFLVYDFDGDGKAEVVVRTSDGTIDGTGHVIGDPNADYRSSVGRVMTGPEYLSVFDGETGKLLANTDFSPARGNVCDWGDCYGNRVNRFLGAVAYLDGVHPSIVMTRGYYEKTMLTAYNFRDGKLSKLWTFDSDDPGNKKYEGQGNHNLSVGDVDGDGKDEIMYGAEAFDDDGTPLYSTGLGHGDAMHLGNLDPSRPGLEVFDIHEDSTAKYGFDLRNAGTGEIYWGEFTGKDTGRGMAADIDPRYKGAEFWAGGPGGVFNTKGQEVSDAQPSSTNFGIWWDGDLLRELLDHTNFSGYDNVRISHGTGTISKWDYENSKTVTLLKADGAYSDNGTKGNPSLQADILGDWREEAIWRNTDSTDLRIYTTTNVTDHRIYTLMDDHIYRMGIAWQNVGYNQPPHTSFYLGAGMKQPPRPELYSNQVLSASVTVKPGTVNAKSQGGKLSATIKVSTDQQLSLQDLSAVRLDVNGKTIGARSLKVKGDTLKVRFDRQDVIKAFNGNHGQIEVTAVGYLTNGTAFKGTDVIKVIH